MGRNMHTLGSLLLMPYIEQAALPNRQHSYPLSRRTFTAARAARRTSRAESGSAGSMVVMVAGKGAFAVP